MPIPVAYETPELQSNESLKGFTDTDSLGKAYIDLHGKFTGGSMEVLPEEMRKDPTLSVFKTVPELAKGYVEAKKMIGGIERAPEKPDGYKFTALDGVHPNIKVDMIQKSLMGVAHKAGVGNKVADIYQQEIITMLSQSAAQQETAKKELAVKNETALRQEWGADYDKKFDHIVKTMIKAGGPEAATQTDAITAAMKGSPGFLKMMGSLVGMLSEDSINKLNDESGDAKIVDKEKAQARINEIIKTKSTAVTDVKHDEHAAIKKEWDELHQVLYK